MRSICLIALLAISSCAWSQDSLSAKAEISVLTLGPFQGELYSAFGHSAIRVYDPELGIDNAYNWGVFDFNQPNFYLNFARGHLLYKLGIYPYDRFRDYYIYHNRYVHEQVLNLTTAQKQKLYDYLVWNSQPENQNYLYDYFYNNCATKVRDVLTTVFSDSVKFDGSYVKTDYSIRDLTDIYLAQQPWGDLGIDICLGLPMDKKATAYEYMFLPDYVESGFNHATLNGNALVKDTVSIYESRKEETAASPVHPVLAFSVFALLSFVLSIWDFKRKKISKWFDSIFFGIMGVIGLLLFVLWFFTDHKAAAVNFNLLWALPTHIVVAVALFKNRKWLSGYFLITGIVSTATLLFWAVLPQQLNYFLIPVVISIMLRSGINWYLNLPQITQINTDSI
jgi:hypothetical protein